MADVVVGCSDTDEQPKTDWRPRQERHLAEASDDVRLVSACDKLHNARCTVADLRTQGPKFWQEAFNAGPDDQRWYYEALVAVFRERFRRDPKRPRLLAELDLTIGELSALAA